MNKEEKRIMEMVLHPIDTIPESSANIPDGDNTRLLLYPTVTILDCYYTRLLLYPTGTIPDWY